MEAAGEDMMEEMMAQFEALGDKEDYNEVGTVAVQSSKMEWLCCSIELSCYSCHNLAVYLLYDRYDVINL